jgi:trk system potassium uptake protein TrkH
MSPARTLHTVGALMIFVSAAMLLALGVTLIYRDGDTWAFAVSAMITLTLGLALFLPTKAEGEVSPVEGYAIVTAGWLGMAAVGALPFLLAGVTDSPVAAFFESISGFTTTGATIFTEIESLPHGILFWRSLTHWIGGMGIIVLAIAILPFLGVGGMQLFKAEVPGPTPDRLRPRITQTAKLLWYVYVGITAAQIVLYLLAGMGWFDAVNHAFATLATGGFSTKNASLGAFDSVSIQWITIVFMYLAGVNFALHFQAVTGRITYLRDAEWRFFTLLTVGAGLAIAAVLLITGSHGTSPQGVETALRVGLFQSTSIVTTTGFVSADFEAWVAPAQGILFVLLFTGGMAGSTGGGVKALRVMLLLTHVRNELRKLLHPRAVVLARVGRKVVREDVMANVLGFVILYALIFMAGALVLTLFGIDLLTAVGASAATVGNIGPGLGEVGAADNYGWMSSPVLAFLSFLMLVGRLEIYTVLLLFSPELWRRGSKNSHRIPR